MYYKAERRVTSDGLEIIDYIPAFLLMDESGFDVDVIVRFLHIMESEIDKGHSFDMTFFKSCRFFLTDWVSPNFGSTPREIEVMEYWLSKLDNLENRNILKTHKNNNGGYTMINSKEFWTAATGGYSMKHEKLRALNKGIAKSEAIIEKILETVHFDSGDLIDEYNYIIHEYDASIRPQG